MCKSIIYLFYEKSNEFVMVDKKDFMWYYGFKIKNNMPKGWYKNG